VVSRSSLADFSALWRAYGEGRLERSLELVDPECELLAPDGHAAYAGPDGVRQWLSDVRRAWKSVTVSCDEVVEPHAGCVVGTGRIVASADDGRRTLDTPLAFVAQFRAGRLRRARGFADVDDARRYAATLPDDD
jgi:ketosteroid isomerase-like protein